jgi:hypothetical protein
MSDYQNRVKEELEELKIKIKKLTGFLLSKHSDTLGRVDRNLLLSQLDCMNQYANCLYLRVARFK